MRLCAAAAQMDFGQTVAVCQSTGVVLLGSAPDSDAMPFYPSTHMPLGPLSARRENSDTAREMKQSAHEDAESAPWRRRTCPITLKWCNGCFFNPLELHGSSCFRMFPIFGCQCCSVKTVNAVPVKEAPAVENLLTRHRSWWKTPCRAASPDSAHAIAS